MFVSGIEQKVAQFQNIIRLKHCNCFENSRVRLVKFRLLDFSIIRKKNPQPSSRVRVSVWRYKIYANSTHVPSADFNNIIISRVTFVYVFMFLKTIILLIIIFCWARHYRPASRRFAVNTRNLDFRVKRVPCDFFFFNRFIFVSIFVRRVFRTKNE